MVLIYYWKYFCNNNGHFILGIIQDTLFFTIGGLSIGTLLYILGRYQGKKDGFDYSARMEKDYHLLENK